MSTRSRRFGARAGLSAALVLCAVAASGCFNPFSPRIASGGAPTAPAPTPTTAADVLRLFQWCWKNRAITEYREIFTDNYEFKFSARDSAGNSYDPNVRPWRREDELQSAEKLFVTGTATDPPATSITFDYTSDLRAVPDGRPGKNPIWHRQIHVQVLLRINVGESSTEIKGPELFFLVRGDSAAIPQELLDRGFKPDTTRWWIERWEDETTSDGPQTAMRPSPGASVAGRLDAAIRAARLDGVVPAQRLSGASDAAPYPGVPLPPEMTWGQLKATFATRP